MRLALPTSLDPIVDFVKVKHSGQKRMNGSAYWTHPVAVAEMCQYPCKLNEYLLKVALCHDILEDTDTTFEELSDLIGRQQADDVLLLTKPKNKPKERSQRQEWTNNYYMTLRKAPKGIVSIKCMDRVHNLAEMMELIGPEYDGNIIGSFQNRYLADTMFLIGAIDGYANEDHLDLLRTTYWHTVKRFLNRD